MWFVSKKKYNEMVAERDKWDGIASEAIAQNGRLLTQINDAIKEMESIQELNHRLVAFNDELLVCVKKLEAEKEGLELRVDILNTDYDALDYEYGRVCGEVDALREERDHYEERCLYLEGEIEDKEELEAKLDLAIKQRDYYYDLLESTSDAYEEGKAISREAE